MSSASNNLCIKNTWIHTHLLFQLHLYVADRTREEFILTSWFRKTLYNSSGEVRKVSFIVKDTVEILTPVLGAFFVVEDPICGGTKTYTLNFDTELKY